MEEAEVHPAVAQHAVERAEDRLAHAAVEPVHQRALVGEGDPDEGLDRLAGGQVRLGRVAFAVGEDEVVEPLDEGCVLRRELVRAVLPEPVAQVVVVDRVEALDGKILGDDAGEHGAHRVRGVVQEAGVVVRECRVEHRVAQPRDVLRQQAVDDGRVRFGAERAALAARRTLSS